MYTSNVSSRAAAPFVLWAFLLAIFVPLFVFSFLYNVPAEDAVILFDYAKNLATKGVITYGGSEVPIEGATDFLWMAVIALFRRLGVGAFTAALSLNFLSVILIISLFKNNIQKAIVGMAMIATPFLYSSLVGFSAICFSGIYVLTLGLLYERSRFLYLSILLLCLMRPDGVAWALGVILLRAMQTESTAELKHEAIECSIWFVLPGLVYFVWRYRYFGELLPLPFIVKSSSTRDLFVFYQSSLSSVLMVFGPIALTLMVFLRKRKELVEVLVLLSFPLVFYSAVSLEQNFGNRFMAPLFFGGMFLVAQLFGWRALALLAVVSVGFQLKSTVGTVVTMSSMTHQTVHYLSKDLAELNGRMLTTEAGHLAHYSNWRTEDSWGLNTPRFAHSLISAQGIEEGNYDLIVAHCDLSLLESAAVLGHDGSRNWENQCRTLVGQIKRDRYEVFLVPYADDGIYSVKTRLAIIVRGRSEALKGSERCNRYDIFAVSPEYAQANALRSILVEFGAIRYSPSLSARITRDRICER